MKTKSKKRSTPPVHPTTAYVLKVVAGQIVAGRLVRLACKRHLDDLRHGRKRGLFFDEETANHALDFFAFLRLDGDATKPFVLLGWESFIVGSIFGWRNADGTRRFRTGYVEAGKGSGKTPLAAGIGSYGLMGDGEWAAEIYCAAVTREQAHTCFRDAKRMTESSLELEPRLEIGEHNIAYHETNSFLIPISSEARSLDSKRVHMALIDEVHEHRTAIVVDKMNLSKKGRLQPLTLEITNSGYDTESVCYQHHEYSRAVLEGRIQNDSWFAYVCQLDPCSDCEKAGKLSPSDDCKKCDDWRDERVWIKTNPSLEINLPRIETLRQNVQEAIGMPTRQNGVKRFNFCIWTEQEERWLDLDLWDAGTEGVDPLSLRGRECYLGLDLSSNRDITAAALIFPPIEGSEKWKLLCRFWIPERNVADRVKNDGVPYDVWIRHGYLRTTPGNVVDKDFIENAILQDAQVYKIVNVCYDRLFADQLVQHLENERPGYVTENYLDAETGKMQKQWCIPIGMGYYSMAAPCKEFERLVQGRLLQHGGHPVLRWMAGNVSIKLDPAGNMKPNKVDQKKRIDGIVAVLMGLARAMLQPQEAEQKSVYDERGPLSL